MMQHLGGVIGFISGATIGGASVAMAVWTVHSIAQLKLKKRAVSEFARAVGPLLGDSNVPEHVADFLEFMALRIQDKKFAEILAFTNVDDSAPRDGMLMTVDAMPDEQRNRFYRAIHYFVLAISFASSRYGRKIRERFIAKPEDKRAITVEVERAYDARHDNHDGMCPVPA